MDERLEIRRKVLVEGVSKRQMLRQTGMHWRTLEKILTDSVSPGCRRSAPIAKPKIGPFLGKIQEILAVDKQMVRKQRHTAKKIWHELQKDGFTGKYTIVKDAVRALKNQSKEVFMPLLHRPGEAQMDFGEALVKMGGVLRKVHFLAMVLPHSDAMFVMAFERECTETFWEGHVRGFAFFGGVPWRISYDNTRVCVARILGPRERELTEGFPRPRAGTTGIAAPSGACSGIRPTRAPPPTASRASDRAARDCEPIAASPHNPGGTRRATIPRRSSGSSLSCRRLSNPSYSRPSPGNCRTTGSDSDWPGGKPATCSRDWSSAASVATPCAAGRSRTCIIAASAMWPAG